MTTLQFVFTGLSAGSGILLLILTYQGWVRRGMVGAPAFAVLMASAAGWAIFYALELGFNDLPQMMIANALKYIGIMIIPVAWVSFAGQFTGSLKLNRRIVAALMVIPILHFSARLAYPHVELFFTGPASISLVAGFPTIDVEWGTLFITHSLYSYTLTIVGTYWLLRTAFSVVSLLRHQTSLIILAVLIPLVGNMITVVDIGVLPGIDIAPILFTITGFLLERLLGQSYGLGVEPISYDQIINGLPNGIMVVDTRDVIISVNPSILAYLKRQESDLLGKELSVAIPEAKGIIEQYRNKSNMRAEFELSGNSLELNVLPLKNTRGEIHGKILVLRDITVAKKTQIALYAHERRYRALFENSNDGIIILDREQKIIIANQQAADLLKTPLADLLEQSILPYIPDYETRRLGPIIKQVQNGEKIPLHEMLLCPPTGETVPVEIGLTLVRDNNNQSDNIQIIIRDITERKRTEQQLQKRLDEMAALREVDFEVTRTLDIDYVLQLSLNAAMRLSGADAAFIALTEEENVVVRQVSGTYRPDVIGNTLHYDIGIVGRVLANQKPELVLDVHQDSDYFQDIQQTEALMAIPLVTQDRLVGIINLETTRQKMFNQNIFEFIQLLANRLAAAVDNARLHEYVRQQLGELQELYEELRRAEHIKTDMIRIANHDLKNPVAIVRGYVELMGMDIDTLPEEYKDYFEEMRKALDRMDTILQDFLSVEAFSQRISNMLPVNMQELAERATEEYRLQAKHKAITLETDFKITDHPIVKGDDAQLYEAMTNLISNALKYTPNQGSIRVELCELGDDQLLFAVHDTGYGVPADRQQHLFEPFYRSKTSETIEIEGTGLGLHLVKNIIERHNGHIVFKSVYQQGSTFGFRLPKESE